MNWTKKRKICSDVAFLYERLSRDDDLEGESYSIATQKKLLTKVAKEKGYTHIVHFFDDGISGVTMNRPKFNEMIEQLKLGKGGAVFVKDLSRLGRNYIEVGRLIEEFFPENGIRLVAVSDGIDSFEGESEFAPIKNLFNEWYSRDISKKRRISNKVKGSSGVPLGAPPYGYKRDEKDPNYWVIDEEAASVVKMIDTLTLSGYGTNQIATMLSEKMILTPTAYAVSKGYKKPLKQHTAGILIVVDMQNDFIDGTLGTKEAVAIVPKVEEKVRNFDGEVFFTRDTHETYYLETQEGKNLPVPHCIRGTDGWQIREELDALRKTEPIDKETFGKLSKKHALIEYFYSLYGLYCVRFSDKPLCDFFECNARSIHIIIHPVRRHGKCRNSGFCLNHTRNCRKIRTIHKWNRRTCQRDKFGMQFTGCILDIINKFSVISHDRVNFCKSRDKNKTVLIVPADFIMRIVSRVASGRIMHNCHSAKFIQCRTDS